MHPQRKPIHQKEGRRPSGICLGVDAVGASWAIFTPTPNTAESHHPTPAILHPVPLSNHAFPMEPLAPASPSHGDGDVPWRQFSATMPSTSRSYSECAVPAHDAKAAATSVYAFHKHAQEPKLPGQLQPRPLRHARSMECRALHHASSHVHQPTSDPVPADFPGATRSGTINIQVLHCEDFLREADSMRDWAQGGISPATSWGVEEEAVSPAPTLLEHSWQPARLAQAALPIVTLPVRSTQGPCAVLPVVQLPCPMKPTASKPACCGGISSQQQQPSPELATGCAQPAAPSVPRACTPPDDCSIAFSRSSSFSNVSPLPAVRLPPLQRARGPAQR